MPISGASGEDQPALDDLARARTRTRDDLGSELELKASDAFCLTFASAQPRLAYAEFAAESIGAEAERAPGIPAVLEFGPPTAGSPPILPEREADVPQAVWTWAEGVMEELTLAEKVPSVFFREARVKSARDDFFRTIGAIGDSLERTTAALGGRRSASRSPVPAPHPIQACWLNRTVRASTDPRALSEIAGDRLVERIDVPRRLEQEQPTFNVIIDGAREVRKRTGLTGKGITLGVIDSEVALRHPAFQDRVIHQSNFTREPFGVPGSHGTAVAGIIGAKAEEFEGIAPEATLYNYKVLATNRALNADDFDGALAIQAALEDGVRVVNCSWGAGPAGDGSSREARACDTAWGLGLVVVKSAGNKGPGSRTLTTPADAEGVIVVGATDASGRVVQDYSSRGPAGDRERPHLVAPGGELDAGLTSALETGGFGDVGAGTSYAAPHVTGLVALLLEGEPGLTPGAAGQRLLGACQRLSGFDAQAQGAGLLSTAELFPATPL